MILQRNYYIIAKNNLSQRHNMIEVENATLRYIIEKFHPKVVLLHLECFLLRNSGRKRTLLAWRVGWRDIKQTLLN